MSQPVNLPDYASLLNEQVIVLELMLSLHHKVDSLLETALNGDFLQSPTSVIHDCLWVISDVTKQATVLNEDLLGAILKILKILPQSPTEPSNDPPVSGGGILH